LGSIFWPITLALLSQFRLESARNIKGITIMPLLCIHFNGTGLKSNHRGSTSLHAFNHIEEGTTKLLLTGVGAESTKSHPTPGTVYYDATTKDFKEKYFHFGERAYRYLGLLWGVGEHDNVDIAMKTIDKAMETSGEQRIINISGYSRGGASALRLANAINKKYGSKIKLNLFLIDPHAGLGRTNEQDKRYIPPNVQNIYFSLAEDEQFPLLKAPRVSHYFTISPETKVHSRALKGGHHAQDLIPKVKLNEKSEANNPLFAANINRDALEAFYQSENALVPPKESPFQTTQDEVDPVITDFIKEMGENHSDPAYNTLSYYILRIYNELKSKPNDPLFIATRDLMMLLKESQYDAQRLLTALKAFDKAASINSYSDTVQTPVAIVAGLVAGFLFGAVCAVGGFFGGASRLEAFMFFALPGLILGGANGLLEGFNFGYDAVLGNKNVRLTSHSINELITEFKRSESTPPQRSSDNDPSIDVPSSQGPGSRG
jgi:hypothetical protein